MSNTAIEVQVSSCNFWENKPVMDLSILAQQEFLNSWNWIACRADF